MISIVLPAYQEEENLRVILPQIHMVMSGILEKYEIIVVDTMHQMDNTNLVCIEENAIYINRKNGNNYGDAIRTGIRNANGDYLVIMDADGSHNPRDIIRFYNEMKISKCDVIIGSRYCVGGRTDNPFILKFMSWALNVTYRVFFRLNVKDVSNSFRMYKTNQIKGLDLECNNFDIVEEILIKLNCLDENIILKEIPIQFNKRMLGESKRDLFKFIQSYLKTMARLSRIRKRMLHYYNKKI